MHGLQMEAVLHVSGLSASVSPEINITDERNGGEVVHRDSKARALARAPVHVGWESEMYLVCHEYQCLEMQAVTYSPPTSIRHTGQKTHSK